MRKKPTIAGLQREVESLKVQLKDAQSDTVDAEKNLANTNSALNRANYRADELSLRLQGAEQEVEFLKGKIEGMQWMLQQVPADE